MKNYLWPYRWQIGLLPFFVASVWLALSLEVAGNKAEFVTISIFYAIADVLIVNFFVAESSRVRVFSQLAAMMIFASIFTFTYIAYGEAQYALAQPLFWVAGWKITAAEIAPRWYPRVLSERMLAAYVAIVSAVALWLYVTGGAIPTIVNLLQFIGLCLFGLSLAVKGEVASRELAWNSLGSLGLDLYVLTCLADVAYKYATMGEIIATPLVAFLAASPVAIVATRDLLQMRRRLGVAQCG